MRSLAALLLLPPTCSPPTTSPAGRVVCPQADDTAAGAADVVIVAAGGRPDPGVWGSVVDQAAAWLDPASGPSVRVAVAQHEGSGGLEVLTPGGFVASAAELRRVEAAHFRRAPLATPRRRAGPWRRPSPPTKAASADAVSGVRAAAAVLRQLQGAQNGSAALPLRRRGGHTPVRVLVLATAASSDILAEAEGGAGSGSSARSRQLRSLQESMELDFGAVEAAVSDARAAAGALRRALAEQAPPLEPQPATAAVERLRIGFLVDRALPAVLRRAVFGEETHSVALYSDGREAAAGVAYHRAREACREQWHALCGKGGALLVRLMHDGLGVRLAEFSTAPPGLPLRWLLPMPRVAPAPCEPALPWALPRGGSMAQPPPERDCSLHPTRDAVESRSAVGSERMTGVSEYDRINQMLVAAADADTDGEQAGRDDPEFAAALAAMPCGEPPHHGSALLAPDEPASAERAAALPQRGHAEVLRWDSDAPFAEAAIESKLPMVIHSPVMRDWVRNHTSETEGSWSWSSLRSRLASHELLETKRSKPTAAAPSFFDPDPRSPFGREGLVGLAGQSIPYEVFNGSCSEVFDAILREDDGRHRQDEKQAAGNDRRGGTGGLVYHFDRVPAELRGDLAAVAPKLFLREGDLERYEQYVWFSSAGVAMHTHLDADHNFFLQVSGRKRWRLFPTRDHAALRPFPRTHPLWHKAQRRPPAPELEAPLASPIVVDVGPGDVLYVPPYTWHSVETLTPSISLSSWSDYGNVRTLMTHLYRAQPHEFDSLARRRGRLFALRVYVHALLHGLHGHGPQALGAEAWIERHIAERYRGLEYLFPSVFPNITATEVVERLPARCRKAKASEAPQLDAECIATIGQGAMIPAHAICDNPAHEGRIPVEETLAQELQFQADTASNILLALPSAEVRELLLADYIDELVTDVVGAARSYAFLRYCFAPQQTFLLTRCDLEVCHPESVLYEHFN